MGPLFDITGSRGFIDMGIPIHATVADALSTSRRRHHRTEHLRLIEATLADYRSRPVQETEDISLWKHAANTYKTSFHSKKTWTQLRDTGPTKDWYRGIWFTHATPKFTFLAWLAVNDRLATGDRMLSWNVGANPSCVLCQHALETRDHLFFTCSFSAEVWSALTKGLLKRCYSQTWQSIVSIISGSALPHLTLFLTRYVFQATIHTVWRERNARRHGEQPLSSNHLIKTLDKLVRNRISSIRSLGDSKYEDALHLWFEARS
ncbi:unnamed protein product [Microthlaspi erraticum]|uniref:Reverse transcriptase zinc-binding domain-containing protein n=1 Tax=Microthlaspi erraticum TaxID=1685480 RepID=A0A6D2I7R2_9BRAS|nr:unnamed protein product [Microthlaspi erraticum]